MRAPSRSVARTRRFESSQRALSHGASSRHRSAAAPTSEWVTAAGDENPPPESDVVHVEDGSWFNAADDWGHPQFWNWLWYPQRDRTSPQYDYNDPSTWADIETGWPRERDSRIASDDAFGHITSKLWGLLREESMKAAGMAEKGRA